jgi:putative nucleotidyltransferase with HDIG domain
MQEAPDAPLSTLDRLRSIWLSLRLWFIVLLGLSGVIFAISVPISGAAQSFGLQVNDVAPQDILAPYAHSYVSSVLTERAREVAASEVNQVYDPPDSSVARQQIEQLNATLNFIEAVRADNFAARETKLEDLAALEDVRLDAVTAQAILEMPDSRWESVKAETRSVLEQVMRTEIRPGRIEEARRTIPALISISMPENQGEIVKKLAPGFVAPNANLNEGSTAESREAAREAVEPITQSYAAGETIVSRGEIVGEVELEALEEYGLLRAPEPWREIAINGLLVLLLGGSFALYAYRTHPKQISNPSLALATSLLFIASAFALQVMIPGRTVLPYIYPAATLPILLAVFFSPSMGILSAFITGTLAGFIAPRGLEMALYITLGGMLAALMIGHAERLGSFIWAGIAASVGSAIVIVIFRIPDPATDLVGKVSLLGASFTSGILSASLGFGLLLAIGNAIGITTNLQLIELSRPDHPLLQQILRNAPGTYQHSLQVANLAEQAARAIDANALLTRVGALYHDLGKAQRPQYFIENQVSGQNVHDQLDPKTSADIILGHVREGLDMARKHRIPESIRAFITEHHGTLETTYQYNEAVEAAGGDESTLDRRDFRYPGPSPRSRETALLMLADGVEAAARAENPQDQQAIDDLVRWVIEDRMSKGQLDRTNLTLKDLDTIRKSFVSTLKNIYHPRVRYPNSNAKEPQKTPTAPAEDATPLPSEQA